MSPKMYLKGRERERRLKCECCDVTTKIRTAALLRAQKAGRMAKLAVFETYAMLTANSSGSITLHSVL